MAKIALFTVYDHIGLGLRILASHLEAHGHTVTLLFLKKHRSVMVGTPNPNNTTYEFLADGKLYNTCFDVVPWTEREVDIFLGKLRELEPDIIGMGSRSVMNDQNISLLHQIKTALPGALLLGGGFGPSLDPDKYLAACDYVMLGEGEDSMLQLADHFADPARIRRIIGVAYLDNDELVINNPRIDDLSIDRHPFPKYGKNVFFIDDNRLIDSDIALDERIYYTMFGRGCVSKCTYCCSSQWSSMYHRWGAKFPNRRNRSIENMVEELKIASNMGFYGICFVDTYLIASPKKLVELFLRIKNEVQLPFDAHLHMQQVQDHPEILETALSAGLHTSSIGIQHGCERVSHDIYGRTLSNDLIKKAAQLYMSKNMHINYSLIEGNPLASEEDFAAGLELTRDLPFNPETCAFTVHKLKNLPKTPLTQRIQDAGFSEESKKDWYHKALLTNLRILADDDIFNDIRASAFFKKHPDFLSRLMDGFIVDQYQRRGYIVFRDDLLAQVYERRLMQFHAQDIIVWWSETYWERFKHLFGQSNIIAFLNSDKALHGRMVGDQPIVGPEFLNDKEGIPVFICSPHKKEIVQRIHDFHGANHLII